MTTQKPREFWLQGGWAIPGNNFDALTKGVGPITHVIEYPAYQALEEKLKSAESEIERIKSERDDAIRKNAPLFNSAETYFKSMGLEGELDAAKDKVKDLESLLAATLSEIELHKQILKMANESIIEFEKDLDLAETLFDVAQDFFDMFPEEEYSHHVEWQKLSTTLAKIKQGGGK
jgi:hypothetical protein